MKKTKPGYYRKLSNTDYHASKGVSKSKLDLIRKAPALLEWSEKAPRDDEARAAVDIGDALHAILLEPDRFEAEYADEFEAPDNVIVTIDHAKAFMDERGIEYTSKDGKGALLEKLLAAEPDAPVLERLRQLHADEHRGKTILTRAELRKLRLMQASAMAHPFARTLLKAPGDVEASIFWKDPVTGVLCRMRPDKLPKLKSGKRFILDVKSTADIERFAASIEDYRYHVQDAFYSEGYEQHFGAAPDGFIFLAISTQRDAGRYPVRCFVLDPEDRAKGRTEFRTDLDTFAACEKSGSWPGVESISRPEWARRRDLAAA